MDVDRLPTARRRGELAACSTQSEYFHTFIAADIVTSIVEQTNGYSVWRQKLTEHNFISAFF